jgi:26S proteasome regulatory subunit N2
VRFDHFYQNVTFLVQAPVLEIVSNARPSLFAYPAPTKPPTKETVEKVATAVLSTTAKAKARAKEKKEKGDAIETVSLLLPSF